MWPCIVENFFIIKPIRCNNFTNLFWHETLHVSCQNKFVKLLYLVGLIIKKLPSSLPSPFRWNVATRPLATGTAVTRCWTIKLSLSRWQQNIHRTNMLCNKLVGITNSFSDFLFELSCPDTADPASKKRMY